MTNKRSMGLTLLSSSIAAGLLLGACSDPKAANKTNFAKVIEPLLVDLPCRRIDAGENKPGEPKFPWHFPIVIRSESGGLYPIKPNTIILDQLVAARLMTVSRTIRQEPGIGHRTTTITLASYTPTAGQTDVRLIDQNVYGAGIQKLPAFCAGKGKLDSVESWTEPADMFGSRVTVVTYRWKADGMSAPAAAMMEKAKIGSQMPINTARVQLTLTNEGWRAS